MTGRADRSESHRRGIRDQAKTRRRKRRKTDSDQNCPGDGDRCTESCCSLKKSAESKGDQQKLQPAIFRDGGDAVLQDLEVTFLQGQLVKKDHVQDNPTDRQ